MKRILSKAIALAIALTLLIPMMTFVNFEASAATYRYGGNGNGPSASYASSVYYENYCKIPITGDNVTDLIAIALSQLGYSEGASIYDMAGNGTSSLNYCEYNYNLDKTYLGDYGGTYYYWCASFVSWCIYQSHCSDQNDVSDMCRNHSGDSNYIWREMGCSAWEYNLQCGGYWRTAGTDGGTYVPQAGNLIFFRDGGHIGIVLWSDGSYVYTVEGNTSDASGLETDGGGVYLKSYSLWYSDIDGYGVLPLTTDDSVPDIDYSGANPTAGYWMTDADKSLYADDGLSTITTTIPRFTMIEATEITANGNLKVSYNGYTGYVYQNDVIQVTSTDQSTMPQDNLARNHSYTVANNNEPYDEADGTYTASLTDGIAATSFSSTDGSWFIFSPWYNAPNNKASVTMDFYSICSVNKLRLHLANNAGYGISAPTSIKAYGSTDGVAYELIGEIPVQTGADDIYWTELELATPVNAGSVRFDFEMSNGYGLINELEIHGESTGVSYTPAESVTVSFNANGGIGAMEGAVLAIGSEYTLPENTIIAPTDTRFKGWDVNGTTYQAGAVIIISEDTSISAIWGVAQLRGDLNDKDGITNLDYLILKRMILFPDEYDTTNLVADINCNGTVTSADYILLRRICLGLYSISEDDMYC